MAEHPAGLASEKEARDVAEAARESEWSGPSFVRELFLGRFRLDLIHPHPVHEDAEEAARAKAFFSTLRAFLERVDSDMIDRTGLFAIDRGSARSHWSGLRIRSL